MPNQEYRHEYKFLINEADAAALRSRLTAFMRRDAFHAESGGRYTVRSLYFDNASDQALREKLDGVDEREKFRIRCYDEDTAFIRLEKKGKKHGLCRKTSAPMTREEVEALIAGDTAFLRAASHPLLNELAFKMTTLQLRPRALVIYDREAYAYPAGNVRVTFDSFVRSGLNETDLFNFNLPLVRVLPAPYTILEVKFDEYLPDTIRTLCHLDARVPCACSKYALCRI